MRLIKKILRISLISFTAIAVLISGFLIYYYNKDHTKTLLSGYSPIESVKVNQVFSDSVSSVLDIVLNTGKITDFRCYLRVPSGDGPYPVIVLPVGINTGKDVINLINNPEIIRKYVILSLDYMYDGPTSNVPALEFVGLLPKIRQATFDTFSGILSAVDYLETRPDVDKDNIFIAGVSFGTFYSITAGALDKRFKAVVSLYGAGDISLIIKQNVPWGPDFTKGFLGFIASIIVLPFEPLNIADRISPRHFLMVNGKNDDFLPVDAVERLYNTAGEPKELIWLDTGHVFATKNELIAQLAGITVDWLDKNVMNEKR
ncbi:alpha/beta hydrolase family protein [candidate division KSB1 bacterium]